MDTVIANLRSQFAALQTASRMSPEAFRVACILASDCRLTDDVHPCHWLDAARTVLGVAE